MKSSIWNWMGFGVGVIVLIVGIVFLLTPPDSYYTDRADEASFGADFYTYEYEATRIAASNAAVTANNIRELGDALSKYAGFFFMTTGMLTIVHYGKSCFVKEYPAEKVKETNENENEHKNDIVSDAV